MEKQDDPPQPPEHGRGQSLHRMMTGGTLWSLAARFGHSGVMVLGTVFLARMLTPADFGLVAIVMTSAILMLVISEGLVDFPLARAQRADVDIVTGLFAANLALVAVAAAGVVFAAPWIEARFGMAGLAPALLLVTSIFVLQVVLVTGRALMRQRHEFGRIASITFMSSIIYVGSAVAMALAGAGFWSLLGGQVASNLFMAAAFARAGKLRLGWFRRGIGLRAHLRIGASGMASRLFAWFWTSIDTIAAGLTLSATATGLYSRAYNLGVQVKEPFATIDHPMRQALAAIRDSGGDVRNAAKRMLMLIALATSITAAGVVALRYEIVWLLLGPQWQAAAAPFAILVAALPARIALNFIDNTVIVAGRMGTMVGRHALLALVIGTLVWVAAPNGIIWIAALVAGSLYLSLLIPRGRTDASIPGAWDVVRMLAPGIATGGVVVAAAEMVLRPAFAGPIGYPVAVVALLLLVAAVWVLAYPTSMLFDTIAQQRRRLLYRRLPFFRS
jgi:PST family polysaccharide transporter